MVTERVLIHTSRYQLGAVVVFAALALLYFREQALAVLVGGLLMAANFWLIRVLAAKAMGGERPKVAYALALGMKLVVMMGAMALCVLFFHLDVLGFAVGMSSLFVGIGLATAHQAFVPPQVPTASR